MSDNYRRLGNEKDGHFTAFRAVTTVFDLPRFAPCRALEKLSGFFEFLKLLE